MDLWGVAHLFIGNQLSIEALSQVHEVQILDQKTTTKPKDLYLSTYPTDIYVAPIYRFYTNLVFSHFFCFYFPALVFKRWQPFYQLNLFSMLLLNLFLLANILAEFKSKAMILCPLKGSPLYSLSTQKIVEKQIRILS